MMVNKTSPRLEGSFTEAVVRKTCSTLLVIVGLLGAGVGIANSIPAWLDDAISEWNSEKENKDIPIQFVDIKDSFVWYTLPENDEFGQKEIRSRVHAIVDKNGYIVTDEEELVTTGKPPTPLNAHVPKKCWRRSYVLNINALSDNKATHGRAAAQRQRMLTSLICEDTSAWYMGFRIVQ